MGNKGVAKPLSNDHKPTNKGALNATAERTPADIQRRLLVSLLLEVSWSLAELTVSDDFRDNDL